MDDQIAKLDAEIKMMSEDMHSKLQSVKIRLQKVEKDVAIMKTEVVFIAKCLDVELKSDKLVN